LANIFVKNQDYVVLRSEILDHDGTYYAFVTSVAYKSAPEEPSFDRGNLL